MNADTIQALVYLYLLAAIVASICIASSLERRLKARLPATRPYRWGFYCGCMGVACGPLAVMMAIVTVVSGMNARWETVGSCLAYTMWFAVYSICGWFIIQRRRWAWVLGTLMGCNPLLWIINYNYGSKRWGEFGGEAYDPAYDKASGLLNEATKLEARGQVQDALALYERIAEGIPNTGAAHDAQKSAESLRPSLGLARSALVEAVAAPPLAPPQTAEGHASSLPLVRSYSDKPNLEPELMAALTAKGADLLRSGILEFEPWCAKLLANFGEAIASKVGAHLCQIYSASHEELRKRQGGVRVTKRSPVSPALSVSTQAEGDTLPVRLAAVAKPAKKAPLICAQTDSQPSDEPPRQIRAPKGPRAKWRTRRLAVGTVAALVLVAGLIIVWIRRDVPQPNVPQAAATDAAKAKSAGAHSLSTIDFVEEVGPGGVKDLQTRAQRGDVSAQYSLGWYYDNGSGVRQDYAEAVKWYRMAADQGHAGAQRSLGTCYYSGKGVPQDYTEAVNWYRKAADQGHAAAQNWLGTCYYSGKGVPQDYAEAVNWYRKAADQGNARGQNRLGVSYARGRGVPQDYVEAVKWYRKAAEQGDAHAQCNLGINYANGQGVPQDYAEAVKWYRMAADQGHAGAQRSLGTCYYSGKGVPQDYTEAVNWYRKAADRGHATAQSWLGTCYYFGQGVPKDYAEAVKWFQKTAKVGEANAQHDLGMCYWRGEGVPRNDVEAYKWLSLAAAQGFGNSEKERDQLAAEMARAEIVEGQHRAAAFVAKKEGGGDEAGGLSPTPEIAEGKGCAGTGFFVTDDGYFVTCEHVVRGATSFHVISLGGSIPARLIKKDPTIDVAVLKVEGAFRALPVVAQQRVKLGDAVFTIGFPNPTLQGVEPKLTRGEISSMAGIQDNPRYFQISVPVQPGNSGGALVDDRGTVIGVVTSRLDDAATWESSGSLPQNVNYAVKGELVHNFLSEMPELYGKLKGTSTTQDRESASAAAERAAVLVIAE